MRDSEFLEVEVRTSPHLSKKLTVPDIMRNVVYALVPLVVFAVYSFGISALAVIITTTISALLMEQIISKVKGTGSTVRDYSAVITGVLLGLTLPPGFPLWMAALGGFVSILIGKGLFGGLGYNTFNPALVGRAFLQASFPVAITTWNKPFLTERFQEFVSSTLTLPFIKPVNDAITGATPLAAYKFEQIETPIRDLFLGTVSGSLGEVSFCLICLGGGYLALRRMLDWRIPIGIMTTVVVLTFLLSLISTSVPSPLFMLFSGGLALGSMFMATDMVTSPVTALGNWLFAILVGIFIVIIRVFGGLPEGVMYAILLGNAVTPLINRYVQQRVYGTKKVRHG